MTRIGLLAALTMALGLSACGAVDTATRNAPLEQMNADVAQTAPSFEMIDFEVRVPGTLKVSEANSYLPFADIVWRGEAYGNRYEQVGNIFRDSLTLGASGLDGAMPVKVQIEVVRFHALTEKTRYTVGGTHAISFVMTVIDPVTGAVVRGPSEIMADLEGYGGQKALEAEAKGLTQKYRITQHLARVIRDELTLATGFVAPKGGITRRITPIQPLDQTVAQESGTLNAS